MWKTLKSVGLILAMGGLIGCSNGSKSKKTYMHMTEAEQVVEMEKYVNLFNKLSKLTTSKKTKVITIHRGDTDRDMLYVVSTYQNHYSDKEFRQVKSVLKKMKTGVDFCQQSEVVQLKNIGIGFQATMKDLSGKILYESEACKGAVAATPTADGTDPAPKLRGGSSAL